MTDYIADDFSSIAQRLAELEADRIRPTSQPKAARALRWDCNTCNRYKYEHEVRQRDGMRPRCLDCGATVTPEE